MLKNKTCKNCGASFVPKNNKEETCNICQLNLQEVLKMTSIKESSLAYEPQKTKNIADLDKVSVDLEIKEETFNEGTKDEFTLHVVEIDKEQYRVPDSVRKSLKAILQEKPGLKTMKVIKSGEGLNTSYTVVPIE